jgi:putative lipoic acid-binding regulatory protein
LIPSKRINLKKDIPVTEKPKLLQFPCSYPLKVMGRNTNQFQAVVSSIIERHVTEENGVTYRSRSSSGGKYISVTATFSAQSQEQLAAIYQDLNKHELVLMAL